MYSTLWLTCAWEHFYLIGKTCLWRHGNTFLLLSFPPISASFTISKMYFGVTSLWIESSLTSGALHIQISCILCGVVGGGEGWGEAVLLRYACEEALETTQLQAPDSLSYNGSFGAKRSRKNDACIEIYYLPRNVRNRSGPVDNAHFLQQMPF